MSRSKYTRAQYDAVVSDLQKGILEMKEIAEKHNLSYSLVAAWRTRWKADLLREDYIALTKGATKEEDKEDKIYKASEESAQLDHLSITTLEQKVTDLSAKYEELLQQLQSWQHSLSIIYRAVEISLKDFSKEDEEPLPTAPRRGRKRAKVYSSFQELKESVDSIDTQEENKQ